MYLSFTQMYIRGCNGLFCYFVYVFVSVYVCVCCVYAMRACKLLNIELLRMNVIRLISAYAYNF